jgi:hypothetical protein
MFVNFFRQKSFFIDKGQLFPEIQEKIGFSRKQYLNYFGKNEIFVGLPSEI